MYGATHTRIDTYEVLRKVLIGTFLVAGHIMIKETILNQNNRYGRYFLSTEADDDAPSYKANTKVIEVSPRSRSRIDFTDGAVDSDEEDTPEENSEETNVDEPVDDTTDTTPDVTGDDVQEEPPVDMGEDDNTDFTSDTGDEQVDDGTGNQNPEPTETGDETSEVPDDRQQDDTTGGDGTDVSVTDNGTELTTDADDMGEDDNTDFTSDTGDDTSTDDGTQDTSADNTGDETKKGPGIEYDSTRKYALFLNYETLINALTNYITKLENNISDDMNINKIIKTSVVKLREIKDLCYEYMIMKFEVSSYVQSLLFYQNAIIMTQSVFDLLQKMNKYMIKSEK